MSRLVVLVLVCAACGGGDDGDTGDGGTDAPSATGVTITATTVFDSPSGSASVPTDLSTTSFYVLQGTSFTRFPPTGFVMGGTDGTAHIPDVFAGPYLLVVNSNDYEPQTSHAVTWTTTSYGRPDAKVGGANTTLEIRASGMQPWGGSDWYALAASANGATLAPSQALDQTTALPAAGATSFDETFAWGLAAAVSPQPTLLDPAQGDTVTLAHYAGAVDADGDNVQVLAESATLVPTTLQATGDATVLSGAFSPLPATVPIAFHADVDAAVAALPPSLATDFADFSFAVTTGPLAKYGDTGGLEPLSITGVIDGMHDTGTLHLPALDASWTTLVTGGVDLFGVYVIPGTNGWQRYGDTYWQAAFDPTSGTVSLPTSVPMATGATVDGTSVLERFVTWDETSPVTIAIDAPAGDHRVNLSRIDGVHTQVVAFVALGDATSITLPGGLFDPGGYYMLEIGVSSQTSATDQQGSWLPFGKFRIGAAHESYCGDGVVDAALGETCDDGGQGACSTTCE
ncbi:MAG TPA: hypothetical protein VGM88_04940 [Kofleriaceae bacterium]|jgi:hypothetical protein